MIDNKITIEQKVFVSDVEAAWLGSGLVDSLVKKAAPGHHIYTLLRCDYLFRDPYRAGEWYAIKAIVLRAPRRWSKSMKIAQRMRKLQKRQDEENND